MECCEQLNVIEQPVPGRMVCSRMKCERGKATLFESTKCFVLSMSQKVGLRVIYLFFGVILGSKRGDL